MTKEQKSPDIEKNEFITGWGKVKCHDGTYVYYPTSIHESIAPFVGKMTRVIITEALTTKELWPSDEEMFKECRDSLNNFPSQDNEGYRPNRGGYKSGFLMCFLWLKERIGKRE